MLALVQSPGDASIVAPIHTGVVVPSVAVLMNSFGVLVFAANSPIFVTCAAVGSVVPRLILIVAIVFPFNILPRQGSCQFQDIR